MSLYKGMIRKATVDDLDAAERIYHEILDKEAATVSYTNWIKDKYPTRNDAMNALEADTLYVMEVDGQVVAVANLNHIQPPEYRNLTWEIAGEGNEVLVIHTLCVSPTYSGRGYAQQFVAFAEELGRQQNCKTIRFDTYEGNSPATALYTKLGYRIVGVTLFHFQDVIWENLRCFEKAL